MPVAGCDLACPGPIGPELRGNSLVEEREKEDKGEQNRGKGPAEDRRPELSLK